MYVYNYRILEILSFGNFLFCVDATKKRISRIVAASKNYDSNALKVDEGELMIDERWWRQ